MIDRLDFIRLCVRKPHRKPFRIKLYWWNSLAKARRTMVRNISRRGACVPLAIWKPSPMMAWLMIQ